MHNYQVLIEEANNLLEQVSRIADRDIVQAVIKYLEASKVPPVDIAIAYMQVAARAVAQNRYGK